MKKLAVVLFMVAIFFAIAAVVQIVLMGYRHGRQLLAKADGLFKSFITTHSGTFVAGMVGMFCTYCALCSPDPYAGYLLYGAIIGPIFVFAMEFSVAKAKGWETNL